MRAQVVCVVFKILPIPRTKLLLFSDICKYITFFILYFSWKLRTIHAQYTDNTRTIHALFTHYSYHFPEGAVAFGSYSSVPWFPATCRAFASGLANIPCLYTLCFTLYTKNRPPRRFFLLNPKYFTTFATANPNRALQTYYKKAFIGACFGR